MPQQKNPFDQFDAPAQPRVVFPTSPTETDKTRAETQSAQASAAAAAANAARIRQEMGQNAALANDLQRRAKAEADKAAAEARMAGLGTTPEQRNNILAGYRAVDNLQRGINNIVRAYNRGPGTTTGLAGLGDYLPTTPNVQFDAAGNRVRGFVTSALGLTASQSNTEKESARNVGGYIPSSSDRDAVILDKIRALQDLVDEARSSAQTQLGQGAPPASVTPSDTTRKLLGLPPATATGASPGGGGGGTPGGPTDNYGVSKPAGTELMFNDQRPPVVGGRMSPDQEAEIGKALRDGDQGLALHLFQKFTGNPPDANTIAGVNAAIKAMKDNPKAGAAINYGNVDNAAQGADDAKRFGGQLPQALNDRGAAPAADVSARGLANGALFGLPDYISGAVMAPFRGQNISDSINRERAMSEADARLHTANSLISNSIGGAAATMTGEAALARALPTAVKSFAPFLANTGYGAAAGFMSADRGQGAQGAALGGLVGGAGGKVGEKLAQGVGTVVRGVTDPAVQYLRDKGVRLSVGQLLGGWAKGLEDRMAGYPLLGDAVNNIRKRGIGDYNRAGFKQQADTAGQVAKEAVGGLGVENAFDNSSAAYQTALGGVHIPTDRRTIFDMLPWLRLGAGNPRYGDEFKSLLQTEIAPLAPNFRAGMSGQEYQNVDRALLGLEGSYSKMATGMDPKPIAAPVARAFGGIGDAIEANVGRNAPDVLPAYQAAKQSYREAGVLRDAVNAARNGTRSGETEMFMPSQLADAAAANAKRFGGSQGTTNQPFYELSRFGQQVLPSKIPDSGTPGRLLPLLLLGGGAGVDQGVGFAGGDSEGAGLKTGLALSALLAPQTKVGRAALEKLLAARPETMRKAGQFMINNSRAGGLFGAAGSSLLLPPVIAGALSSQ